MIWRPTSELASPGNCLQLAVALALARALNESVSLAGVQRLSRQNVCQPGAERLMEMSLANHMLVLGPNVRLLL